MCMCLEEVSRNGLGPCLNPGYAGYAGNSFGSITNVLVTFSVNEKRTC